MKTADEFWRRVDKTEDCWNWSGATNSTGYGTLNWNGKTYTAHRIAAWLKGLVDNPARPKDPKSKQHVLHTCDNRKCCNPRHFFFGSYSDNQLDAYKKCRRSQPCGPHHANSKLTLEQAVEIRSRYATGSESQDKLAKEFGVSQRVVSLIVRGESYK